MSKDKRLIVVSGGSKGIGRAILEIFAAKKFNVATFSRNMDELNSLKIDLEEKYKVEVYVEKVSIDQKEDVFRFARNVEKLNQPIEILVNNAGFFLPGKISNEEDGALERTMAINVYGAYHLTRALLPGILKNGWGHIFNICSTASKTAYINGGSYCMSKYALLGFSRVLREELKEKNVKVTSVLPGATYTSSWEGVDLPVSRFIQPIDVAKTVESAYELSRSTVVEEVIIRPQLGDIV